MILITGATGLLGSYLMLELLKSNDNIVAAYRRKSSIEKSKKIFSYYDREKDFDKIQWLELDILDYESLLENFSSDSVIYHCAAVVDFGKMKSETIFEVNHKGTENVVNACLENGVKKLIYASSIAALGGNKSSKIINEESKPDTSKNHSPYSLSKYRAETEVWRGINEGLNAVIVNPSIILGAGNWNSGSSKLFSISSKNKFYTDGITGYVDVRDVAKIMNLLAEEDIKGERYIVNAEDISFKDIFSKIALALGNKPPSIYIGKNLMGLFVLISSLFRIFGIKSQISKNSMQAAYSKKYFSADKIKDKLGYEFIPIDETINHIASIYKQDN